MPNPEQTKALFRCLLAYSDGQPVAIFDMTDNDLQDGESLTAIANAGAALKVGVVGRTPGADFDPMECPQLLAAAYEMFMNDRALSSDRITWVVLETT